MAGITLAQAQTALANALAAHAALLTGAEEYQYEGRRIRCPALPDVENSIRTWQGYVDRLSAGAPARGPVVFGIGLGG